MTLKEELEILRGEPIEVFTGDPMDIPCIETSDPERLCKNPVVSVHMITYNHEPYIRQAIEGVMMQKTDFEFDLVIGEDCSQDKTREICFEYQKKYPDKIRVFWWHENVSKLGGNGRRTRAHCRGEFIAFCEGDDYWTDEFKLQRQIDFLRSHKDYIAVADGGDILVTTNHSFHPFNNQPAHDVSIEELVTKRRFPTAGVVLRARYCSTYDKEVRYSFDTMMWCYWARQGKFRYTAKNTSVYRKGNQGITVYTAPLDWARIKNKWYLELYRVFSSNVAENILRNEIWKDYMAAAFYYLRHGNLQLTIDSYKLARKYYRVRTCLYFFLGRPIENGCNLIRKISLYITRHRESVAQL